MKDNNCGIVRSDEDGYNTEEGELDDYEGSVEEVPSAMSRSMEQLVELMALEYDDEDGDVQRRSSAAMEPFEELELSLPHSLAASPSERMSEDMLEDCHAFSDVSVNSSSRRMSWPESGGGSVSDKSVLETLEEDNKEGEEEANLIEAKAEELYDAVFDEDWNTARKLLGTSNARDLVEYASPYHVNALHLACNVEDVPSDIMQSMLNTSATAPLQQNEYGSTPLHWAIKSSSEDVIIRLLEACPRAASIANNHGQTPLHTALIFNKSSIVIHRLLAANPTAATATDRHGDTPLCWLFKEWNVP